MTREERIKATIAELGIVGSGDETNTAYVCDDAERFLLVERNLGSAASSQSHYLTTHATLADAGAYSVSQEYAEDWEIEFAVDLDTGSRHDAQVRIEWTPNEPVMTHADYQGETWMVHGYKFDHGVEDRSQVVLKKSPKDRRRSTYDWATVPTAELTNVKWSNEQAEFAA